MANRRQLEVLAALTEVITHLPFPIKGIDAVVFDTSSVPVEPLLPAGTTRLSVEIVDFPGRDENR